MEKHMEQKLFTELRPLYMTRKESPNEIRIVYDLQDVNELELPNIRLPWTE